MRYPHGATSQPGSGRATSPGALHAQGAGGTILDVEDLQLWQMLVTGVSIACNLSSAA